MRRAVAFPLVAVAALLSLPAPAADTDNPAADTDKQVRRMESANASYQITDGCTEASMIVARLVDDELIDTFMYYTVRDTCNNKIIASGGARMSPDTFVVDSPERNGLSASVDVSQLSALGEIIGTPLVANMTWRADNDTVTDRRINSVTIERKNNPGRYTMREDSHERSSQVTGKTNLFPVVTGPKVKAEMSWGYTLYRSYPRGDS